MIFSSVCSACNSKQRATIMAGKGLLERLQNEGTVCVAEGYIFEFERRGYLKAGTFVPEVVIEHPELVKQLYEEFLHAGSDVVLAFTYYAHREKLRLIGREDELVKMNEMALKMAREVADEHGALMAGNICNSTIYQRDKPETFPVVEAMFKEMVELAVAHGADFIVAETIHEYGEASLALQCIKKYGKGVPAVITLSVPVSGNLSDGYSLTDGCLKLEAEGAAVVGLNCGRGPATMLPLLKKLKKVLKVPVAALPVVYQTTPEQPTFHSLTVPGTDTAAFPLELITCLCSRADVQRFAQACKEIGIQYIGLCCGNSAHYFRIVADVYGKNPPANKYAPEMDKHYIFGDKKKYDSYFTDSYFNELSGKSASEHPVY